MSLLHPIVSWERDWIGSSAYKENQHFAKQDNHWKCIQSSCRQYMVWTCWRYCLLRLHSHNWLQIWSNAFPILSGTLTHVGSSALKMSTDWTFFALRAPLYGGGGCCWQLKVSSFFGIELPWFKMWQLIQICFATDSSIPTRLPCLYMACLVGSLELSSSCIITQNLRSFSKNVVSFPSSLSQEKEPCSFLVFFLGSLNQETEPHLKFLVYLMQIIYQESCTNCSLPSNILRLKLRELRLVFFNINNHVLKTWFLSQEKRPRSFFVLVLGSFDHQKELRQNLVSFKKYFIQVNMNQTVFSCVRIGVIHQGRVRVLFWYFRKAQLRRRFLARLHG